MNWYLHASTEFIKEKKIVDRSHLKRLKTGLRNLLLISLKVSKSSLILCLLFAMSLQLLILTQVSKLLVSSKD